MTGSCNGFSYIILSIVVIVVFLVGLAGWKMHDIFMADSTKSTLSGVVTVGPTAPVCRADTSCTRSVPDHAVEAVNAAGKVVAATRTDSSGHYQLTLYPGHYNLILNPPIGLRATGTSVDVKAGANTFNLLVDTGIR